LGTVGVVRPALSSFDTAVSDNSKVHAVLSVTNHMTAVHVTEPETAPVQVARQPEVVSLCWHAGSPGPLSRALPQATNTMQRPKLRRKLPVTIVRVDHSGRIRNSNGIVALIPDVTGGLAAQSVRPPWCPAQTAGLV